jgi:hypothetical protein
MPSPTSNQLSLLGSVLKKSTFQTPVMSNAQATPAELKGQELYSESSGIFSR